MPPCLDELLMLSHINLCASLAWCVMLWWRCSMCIYTNSISKAQKTSPLPRTLVHWVVPSTQIVRAYCVCCANVHLLCACVFSMLCSSLIVNTHMFLVWQQGSISKTLLLVYSSNYLLMKPWITWGQCYILLIEKYWEWLMNDTHWGGRGGGGFTLHVIVISHTFLQN